MMTLDKVEYIFKNADRICSKADVDEALDRLAAQITGKLKETHPLLLCVMTGGLIPMGHLLTRLIFPLEIDYVHATRYHDAMQGGALHWLVEPHTNLKDRTVLIVDDIMDGGLTLSAIIEYCKKAGAKMVYSAVMVNKMREREPGVTMEPDFNGLYTENRFLFGFGLDYHGYWRNLPEIYAVKS